MALERAVRAAGSLAVETAGRLDPALALAGILALAGVRARLAGVRARLAGVWPLQALMPLQASDVSPNDGLLGVWALAIDATRVPAAKMVAAAITKDFFI